MKESADGMARTWDLVIRSSATDYAIHIATILSTTCKGS